MHDAPKVVVWVVEGTWRSCIEAARSTVPDNADTTLVYVIDSEASAVAHSTFGGLIGRGHPERDPGLTVDEDAAASAEALIDRAGTLFGRPYYRNVRRGRIEREVVKAADGADLLVVARDGDRRRLGPKSLGHASRFVVDHAPCSVLLVWPEVTPAIATIPEPPPPGHRRGHPPRP